MSHQICFSLFLVVVVVVVSRRALVSKPNGDVVSEKPKVTSSSYRFRLEVTLLLSGLGLGGCNLKRYVFLDLSCTSSSFPVLHLIHRSAWNCGG